MLLEEKDYKVKRITVLPGQMLSYQKHAHRSEHWVAVKGQGVITLDGRKIDLNPGEALDIPPAAPTGLPIRVRIPLS